MDHKYKEKSMGQRYTTPAPPHLLTNDINSDPYVHISNKMNIYMNIMHMINKFDRNNGKGFFVQKQITPAPFLEIEQGRNSKLERI